MVCSSVHRLSSDTSILNIFVIHLSLSIGNLKRFAIQLWSPNQAPRRRLPLVVDAANNSRPGSHTKILLNVSGVHDRALQEIQQPQHSECKELLLDAQQKSFGRSASFSERQRKWKAELERKREMLSQAGAGGNTSSPNDQIRNQQRERLRFAFSGKG